MLIKFINQELIPLFMYGLEELRKEINKLDEELVPILVSMYSKRFDFSSFNKGIKFLDLIMKRTFEIPREIAEAKYYNNSEGFEDENIYNLLKDKKREEDVLSYVLSVVFMMDSRVANFVKEDYKDIIETSLEVQVNHINELKEKQPYISEK